MYVWVDLCEYAICVCAPLEARKGCWTPGIGVRGGSELLPAVPVLRRRRKLSTRAASLQPLLELFISPLCVLGACVHMCTLIVLNIHVRAYMCACGGQRKASAVCFVALSFTLEPRSLSEPGACWCFLFCFELGWLASKPQ